MINAPVPAGRGRSLFQSHAECAGSRANRSRRSPDPRTALVGPEFAAEPGSDPRSCSNRGPGAASACWRGAPTKFSSHAADLRRARSQALRPAGPSWAPCQAGKQALIGGSLRPALPGTPGRGQGGFGFCGGGDYAEGGGFPRVQIRPVCAARLLPGSVYSGLELIAQGGTCRQMPEENLEFSDLERNPSGTERWSWDAGPVPSLQD